MSPVSRGGNSNLGAHFPVNTRGFAWICRNLAPPPPSPQRAYGLELIKIDSNRQAGFRDYSLVGRNCRLRRAFAFGIGSSEMLRQRDGRASMACRHSSSGKLRGLVVAIKSSPIMLRLGARLLSAAEWARIRKSPEVDAFVLAWIASHVRGPRRPPRRFM